MHSNLSRPEFNDVNLQAAQFTNVNFSPATFTATNFSGEKFSNLNLTNSEIEACDTTGMKFRGVLASVEHKQLDPLGHRQAADGGADEPGAPDE